MPQQPGTRVSFMSEGAPRFKQGVIVRTETVDVGYFRSKLSNSQLTYIAGATYGSRQSRWQTNHPPVCAVIRSMPNQS